MQNVGYCGTFQNLSVSALDRFWLTQHELMLSSMNSPGLENFSAIDRFPVYTESAMTEFTVYTVNKCA